jgi:PhnB protein
MISTFLAPWLSVRDAARAVKFYMAAFGAVETYHLEDPGGAVVSRLSLGATGTAGAAGIAGATGIAGAPGTAGEFWVSDESPENANFSPQTLGGGTVRLILTVPDPDAVFARALSAGASEVYPVMEEHGWRLGRLVDPFGHHWEIGRLLEE